MVEQSQNTSAATNQFALRMGPVSYVVLGMIGLRGPSTPYELKRAASRSLDYFWPFPHAQLYTEPARLAANGLLREEVEKTGRRRKTYSLTRLGEAALKTWLGSAPDTVFELRDAAVLQLFFSDFMDKDQLVELARKQVLLYQQRLDEYRTIALRNKTRPRNSRKMASLNLGERLVRAMISFWSEIAKFPPEAEKPPGKARALRR
jgi:PadR family transcriptional regulator, regulatory protein AphA